MSQTKFTVILGEREYELKILPSRKASGWRKSLKTPLLRIVGLLAQLSKDGLSLSNLNDSDVGELAPLLATIIEDVHEALELLPDTVLAYSQVLRNDQEYIDENAIDEEFLAAFVEMVKYSYPFGMLMNQARRVGVLGKRSKQTSQS